MAVAHVPSDKFALRKHRVLVSLGYQCEGKNGAGHLSYSHPEQPQVIVSETGYDGRAWQMFLSDMRRRHPDAEQLRQPKSSRPRKSSSERAAERRRVVRQSVALLTAAVSEDDTLVVPVVERIPNPGSQEAVAAGCLCPPYENRHGVGVEGRDGIFTVVRGCSLHWDEVELAREPEGDEQRRCECGNPLPRKARGRPRKWCRACRPSRWEAMTDEERELSKSYVREWYRRHHQEAAA